MSILKRAGDLVYTFRFLKLLTTDFEDTEAYELGLIDKNGKKQKRPSSREEKSAYTAFHRLVFNIKKLIAKAPGGRSAVGSYAAALYLLKEKYGISDSQLVKALDAAGLDPTDILAEQTSWFVTEDKMLAPGSYQVTNDKLTNECDDLVRRNDYVQVAPDSYPVGDVFGLDIYEAVHKKTGKTVYVTIGELRA